MSNLAANRRKAAELMEQAASLLDEDEDAVLLMRLQHAIDLTRTDERMPPEARRQDESREAEA